MARAGRGQTARADEATHPSGDLLERDAEIAALREAVTAAVDGRGSVTVVQGPAGVGKSRLLDAARRGTRRRGLRVLDARACDLDRDVALGVATELLAPPLAEATDADRERALAGVGGLAREALSGAGGTPADPEALSLALYWVTVNLLAAQRERAAVMTVDDVQWADRASLRFLVHLAARVDELPLAIVATLRTGEPESPEDLLDRLRAGANARTMNVAPLTEAAVGRLVDREFPGADPALAPACVRASGGNPFLLRELLTALRAEGADAVDTVSQVGAIVPESVLRFTLVRLARLGEQAQRLTRAAAILGDGAPLMRVAQLAELDEGAAAHSADALADADILEPGGPIRFRHALLRSAVAAELSPFERSRGHGRAAELLAADGEATDVVAMHLLERQPAGDASTVGTLREAARGALARGDPGAAKRILARALAEPPPAPQRGDVLADLARAEVMDADPAAAGHFAEAIEILREPARRAMALSELGGVLYVLDDRAGAAEHAERALAEAPGDGPLPEALLATYLSVASFHADLRPRADERARPVMQAARAGRLPTDPGLLAHVAMRLALSGDSPQLVLEVAERALAVDPLIVPGTHGLLLGFVLHSLACVDQLDAVDRAAEAAMAAAQRTGSTVAFAGASYHRAIANYHRGALTDALADVDQALLPRNLGWTAGDGWVGELLIQIHLERGDASAARDALHLTAGAADDSMDRGLVLDARAKLALADYDPAAALDLAEQAGRHLAEAFAIDHPGLCPWRNTAARAAYLLGDHQRARRLADEGVARARSCRVPREIGAALHTAGAVAEHGAAVSLLREAVDALAQSPSALEYARALVGLGSALRREGRRAECRQPLLEGLELADAMRATPLAGRARVELESVGSRPRRTVLTGVDALTPTERRVAGLAAGGASNPEIAQALFVTVKTIETHLSRVYRKLGITSRNDLQTALS